MIDRVARLLVDAAAEAILPRFRTLREEDIREKAPGDLVTAADGHAEQIITAGLLEILPESRVAGEEACAAEPRLLERLDEGAVWLVDPLDGTANFASGKQPFAVMAALLQSGQTVASWILDPIGGRMCTAELGSGAFINGSRIRTGKPAASEAVLKGAVLTRMMPPMLRASVEKRAGRLSRLPGLLCAGEEYPQVATGIRDFVAFWRALPWDHAPGGLFLTEAGGWVGRMDGTPYRPNNGGHGLIAAKSKEIAGEVINLLFD